jgi:hypothetical protein
MTVNGESYGLGEPSGASNFKPGLPKPELRQPFQLPNCSHEHCLFLLDEHVSGFTPSAPGIVHGDQEY